MTQSSKKTKVVCELGPKMLWVEGVVLDVNPMSSRIDAFSSLGFVRLAASSAFITKIRSMFLQVVFCTLFVVDKTTRLGLLLWQCLK